MFTTIGGSGTVRSPDSDLRRPICIEVVGALAHVDLAAL